MGLRFRQLFILIISLWGASAYGGSPHFSVPSFVLHVPSGHFAGVSVPCSSVAESRKSAVDDVVRQVLSAVNVRYDHRYSDRVSGNVRSPQRSVDDQLSKVAKGVVLGVERGIVKSSMSKDVSGRHVYFILVQYSDKKIQEMRRLSNGAKVVASVVSENQNNIRLRLSEVNGVAVTLSSADVVVLKRNRYAKLISYYVMHVSKGSEARFSVPLEPVRICGGSRTVMLDMQRFEKGLGDYLLGANVTKSVTLKGFDEIGREVRVEVDL